MGGISVSCGELDVEEHKDVYHQLLQFMIIRDKN